MSPEGGALSITERDHLALIRYVKGSSDMDVPHVKAFRSVVWNTVAHRPVSITAFKSETDEPAAADPSVIIEDFADGVMVGQFWDDTVGEWRIHTRSTIDARCRYYSKRSFAELFAEAAIVSCVVPTDLDKEVSYTWVLQHPENRIVCPVQKPRLVLVQLTRIAADGGITEVTDAPAPLAALRPKRFYDGQAAQNSSPTFATAGAANIMLMLLASMRNGVQHQGLVFRNPAEPFRRWKLRSPMYDTVRHLRGNTARRDFMWMDMWSRGTLEDYLKWYPEERRPAMDIIAAWKAVTQEAYNMYVAVFKARNTDKASVPAKLKPLVFGLHGHYLQVLRPAQRSLDWRECVTWANERDTALKVFVLNWEARQARQVPAPAAQPATDEVVPLEPAPTSRGLAEPVVEAVVGV